MRSGRRGRHDAIAMLLLAERSRSVILTHRDGSDRLMRGSEGDRDALRHFVLHPVHFEMQMRSV